MSSSRRKPCRAKDCSRTDAGGGFCIRHGGGKKCKKEGCAKGAQRGGYCRTHGGGSKCNMPGCTKVDAGGGRCRAHGGGRRCGVETCNKADVGGGFCTQHGGGRKCSVPGCNTNAQGQGKCRAHGGFRKCKSPGCESSARGIAGFCAEHGGRKKCKHTKCRRLSVASSDFCKDHLNVSSLVSSISLPEDLEEVVSSCCNKSAAATVPFNRRRHSTSSSFEVEALCLTAGCRNAFGGTCNCASCACCESSSKSTKKATDEIFLNALATTSTSPSIELSTMNYIEPMEESAWYKKLTFSVQKLILGLDSVQNIVDIKSHLLEHMMIDSIEFDIQRQILIIIGLVKNRKLLYELDRMPELFAGTLELQNQDSLSLPMKELVLRVPEMMCMGNCGSTVTKALKGLWGVKTAKIASFDERIVSVTGTIKTSWVISTIQSVGFMSISVITDELVVEPMKKLWVTIQNANTSPISSASTPVVTLSSTEAKDLRNVIISSVPNVSNVMWFAEKSAMAIESIENFEIDKNTLTSVICAQGSFIVLFEESNNHSISAGNNNSNNDTLKVSEPSASHVCVESICSRNGCEKYRATVAHTAALAAGWVVPGCAMAWGGECSCGDGCKCADCPTHSSIKK